LPGRKNRKTKLKKKRLKKKKKAEKERKKRAIPTSDEWEEWKKTNDIIVEEENPGPEDFMVKTTAVRNFLKGETRSQNHCECGYPLKKYNSRKTGPAGENQLLGCRNGFEGCGFKKWVPKKANQNWMVN